MSEAALVLALVAASLTQTAADVARPGVFRITPLRPVAELRAEALAKHLPSSPDPSVPVDLVELHDARRLDPARRPLCDERQLPRACRSTPRRAPSCSGRPRRRSLRAHRALAARGFGLLIHDGYRPWWVTKVFWEATPPSGHDFVADPAKGSRHNRGCAVDLTLYRLADGEAVEMPSLYDEMSERSAPGYAGGSAEARRLRDLLRAAMKREGFSVNPSRVVALRLPRLARVPDPEHSVRPHRPPLRSRRAGSAILPGHDHGRPNP